MKKQQKANKSKQNPRPGLSSQPTTPAKLVELSDKELGQVVGSAQLAGSGAETGKTDATSNVV